MEEPITAVMTEGMAKDKSGNGNKSKAFRLNTVVSTEWKKYVFEYLAF